MSSLSQVNADVLKQAQQRIQQDLLTTLAAFSIPEPLKRCTPCSYARWKTCASGFVLRYSFFTR